MSRHCLFAAILAAASLGGTAGCGAGAASGGDGGAAAGQSGAGGLGGATGFAGTAGLGGATGLAGAVAGTGGLGTSGVGGGAPGGNTGGSAAGGGAGLTGAAGSVAGMNGRGGDGGGRDGSAGSGAGGRAGNGNGGGNGGGAPADGGMDAKPRATFRNPLNTQQGSDPWLTYYDGYYYLTATTWSSVLTIKKSATIAGLKTAAETTVWTGDNPSRCCNFWAPELHLLNGPNGMRWYLYYTGGPSGSDTSNQRNHVLESAGTDPMGPYTYKARIYDSKNDSWAIDPSVVTINGSLYFLFSAWIGDNQDIFIAPMRDPWTLSGSRVLLSQPANAWETSLANVNEGPVALQHDGKTFITYSASACWGPDYKLGMLTLTGTNPLATNSWTKSAQPVFQRADGNSVYGPAHNGFFTSPDGTESWIVYHANSAASGVCDTRRTTRAQPFTWKADGTPNLGVPLPTGADIPVPSGE